MSKHKHIGQSFDEFLEEEGLLEEATEAAEKRVFAWQIRRAMEEEQVSEAELARRMGTSRSTVRRLLDPENTSATLQTMRSAAMALGRQIAVVLLAPAPRTPRRTKKKVAVRNDAVPARRSTKRA